MNERMTDPNTRDPLMALASLVETAFLAAPRDNLPLVTVNGRDVEGLGGVLDGDQGSAMRFAICRALRKHVTAPARDVEIHLWVRGGREYFSSHSIMEASA